VHVSLAVVALGSSTTSGQLAFSTAAPALGQLLRRWPLSTCIRDGGWGSFFVDDGWAVASSAAARAPASSMARWPTDGEKPGAHGAEGAEAQVEAWMMGRGYTGVEDGQRRGRKGEGCRGYMVLFLI
jgi:hypothetical protein